MKVLLLIISLLLVSCGSRQKQVAENESKKISEVSLNSSSNTDLKIARKDSELYVSDLSKTKISVMPKAGKCSDLQSSNQPLTPRNINLKDSKGNETNIPVDENSEIHIETSSEQEKRLRDTELELAESKKEYINLQAKYEELQQQFRSSLESNKPSWWLYILLFLTGIFFIPTIKFFIRK